MTTQGHRVLVISHGHPDISPGGGEHAALDLFRELKSRPGVDALFLARYNGAGSASAVRQHSADGSELLIHSNCEYFRFSQRDSSVLCRDFRRLLESYQPTVVHLHHYVHLGIEVIREIRNFSPTIPIVLTTHEYLAICNHNGQMIKVGSDQLCRRATPLACNGCFPDIPQEDFFLRELYLKSFLGLVDLFISPSRFLIERYVDWGLPRDKFVFLENGQPPREMLPSRALPADGRRNRFALFGQISRYKGLHIALEAMKLLPRELRRGSDGITLDIHGARLDFGGSEYEAQVEKQLRATRGSVRMHGRYFQDDLPALMQNADWVVVPSIWWENSPLVIQEAFAYGRPVICSDIGGMAEKVEDGKNGLLFRVNNPRHLADRMVEAATTPGLWDKLRSGVVLAPTLKETTDRIIDIYDRLGRRAPSAVSLRVV